MIRYVDGTVFNQNVDAIVNTVNVVGVMGAGLALEFSLRYPDMLASYEEKCKHKLLTTGKLDYYKSDDVIIINFPTKWHFKYPSKIEWIESGLIDFVNTYQKFGIKSVAFPRLGTSNGGLDWPSVRNLMEQYLSPLDIEVFICLDKNDAEGLEKRMIDRFNSIDFSHSVPGLKLNKKQMETLREAQPIRRFYQIKELEGIGIVCYKNLFNYCVTERQNDAIQITFFDA